MDTTCAAAFNIQPDGGIVLDGDHAPGTSLGCPFESLDISCTRIGPGLYQVTGPGVQPAAGWRASVYRDENDEPTIRLAIKQEADAVLYTCTDPASGEAKDIVYLLTVRVVVDVSEAAQVDDAEVEAP
ncbi:hypothetical protein MG068_08425 [Stenotrophomonas sp. ASS1]|uniref:hypothetical protein n=1 Tax=Stenotrophomonas sp. ASS1 TaxID=2282124 RepID=UPI001047A91C|nr:hypothetical protein [Stenotrophomonas sp. ASS1]QBL40533.1 hypothetical protein MG068_08425 [Stenotrophomonas sp. ASS1]